MLVTIGSENHNRERAVLRGMFAARKSVFIDLLKFETRTDAFGLAAWTYAPATRTANARESIAQAGFSSPGAGNLTRRHFSLATASRDASAVIGGRRTPVLILLASASAMAVGRRGSFPPSQAVRDVDRCGLFLLAVPHDPGRDCQRLTSRQAVIAGASRRRANAL